MLPSISKIPIQHLASGDRLSIQLYKFIGANPGKKVYLQANLHGAEIVGNAVIHQLIEFLTTLDASQINGEIWLVPVCNPVSTNQRSHFFSTGRYNIYDGKDWNRIFWDYENEREQLSACDEYYIDLEVEVIRQKYLKRIQKSFAKILEKINSPSGVPFNERYRYQLQSLCLDADYVIDIHSSSNQAIDYIYGFRGREKSAKYFLLDYGILLDEYDGNAFDEAFIKPWLGLEDRLGKVGQPTQFDIESWTLELGGGMQMNPVSVAKGVEGIKNYLAAKKILAIAGYPLPTSETMKFIAKTSITKYYAPVGGMIQSRVELGSSVKAGKRLYQILSFNKELELPKLIDICAPSDGLVFDVSTNHTVNEGEYVLSLI